MDWDTIYAYAKKYGAKFPEVVAAQYVLESGNGKHMSGKNNPYGLKGKPGTLVRTQEWDGLTYVTIDTFFKDFDSIEKATEYLVTRWYRNYSGYWGVNNANSPEECARKLVHEKYATDPNYAELLLKIMSEHQKPAGFLRQAATHHKGLPHQNDAWDGLEAELAPETLERFKAAYRTAQAPLTKGTILGVPYYWQRDSVTGHGERMCQSSSIAMVVDYLHPKVISGDDDYLEVVLKHGDTISQSAHLAALRELGFTATFYQNGNQATLEAMLRKNKPVPIGILHKGSISSPTGGGHWLVVIGQTETHFIVHDPFGELDLINGGYPKNGPTDGKQVAYTKKNLMKRWLISSNTDGWYWDIQ